MLCKKKHLTMGSSQMQFRKQVLDLVQSNIRFLANAEEPLHCQIKAKNIIS